VLCRQAVAVASGEYMPKVLAAGLTNFQIFRGVHAVSM
jgi:hypothetical protein